jgi:hypothetical protein
MQEQSKYFERVNVHLKKKKKKKKKVRRKFLLPNEMLYRRQRTCRVSCSHRGPKAGDSGFERGSLGCGPRGGFL